MRAVQHCARAATARRSSARTNARSAWRVRDGLRARLPELRRRARRAAEESIRVSGTPHLYVHLPFCAHRCGYCDFVTAVGRERPARVSMSTRSLRELELEGDARARLETIFLGGGTPTFTAPPDSCGCSRHCRRGGGDGRGEPGDGHARARRARSARPASPGLARRADLPAASFSPCSSALSSRTTSGAPCLLRDAGFDNISLDLIYGIRARPPPISPPTSRRARARPGAPLRYELEAKPGTRFTHARGASSNGRPRPRGLLRARRRHADRRRLPLGRDGQLLPHRRESGRDLRSRHNLAYFDGRDYLGIGMGGVRKIEKRRWRNTPQPRSLPRRRVRRDEVAGPRCRAPRRRRQGTGAGHARAQARRAASRSRGCGRRSI